MNVVSVEDDYKGYKRFVRKKPVSHSIRMDQQLYIQNEIIRVYYSNEFVSPSNADIIKILMDKQVSELRKIDHNKVRLIELAIQESIAESNDKEK